MEATVIETGGNSAGTKWDNTHTGLIDNEGLNGTHADVASMSKCAVSEMGRNIRPFLAMKLAEPKKIMMVQLAFRADGMSLHQGKNVQVQVGSSLQYDANGPVCMEISQLSGHGLVDYYCDQVHEGQYVILSNDQQHLTICEAKVFVEPGKSGTEFLTVYVLRFQNQISACTEPPVIDRTTHTSASSYPTGSKVL